VENVQMRANNLVFCFSFRLPVGPAFSSPAIWSVIFQVMHFPDIAILWSVIFWSCIFSVSIFSEAFSKVSKEVDGQQLHSNF